MALKMRTNTTARPQVDLNCRKCGIYKETLGHILRLCIYMKAQKTHRHDEIKDLVLDTVIKRENQAVASQEPTI
jgi:hypothetical protein